MPLRASDPPGASRGLFERQELERGGVGHARLLSLLGVGLVSAAHLASLERLEPLGRWAERSDRWHGRCTFSRATVMNEKTATRSQQKRVTGASETRIQKGTRSWLKS